MLENIKCIAVKELFEIDCSVTSAAGAFGTIGDYQRAGIMHAAALNKIKRDTCLPLVYIFISFVSFERGRTG